jgi:hypothetical protein
MNEWMNECHRAQHADKEGISKKLKYKQTNKKTYLTNEERLWEIL